MKWAILARHSQGAYWLEGTRKRGERARVMTYPSKEAAQETADNISRYSGFSGGSLEVLEYNN